MRVVGGRIYTGSGWSDIRGYASVILLVLKYFLYSELN